ncbi:hypothetical protein [uncultured Eubacterium sp.]|uniref:hypothetical protein n=1 Tax=uncultured Eubacterium sp. TaxID=165185 RepID=UPI0025D775EA|nr:hypothetical protein [uncultured Eubacterium sp.]
MKKMFKKSIAMLIAVLMVISAMPFTAITAFAADSAEKSYVKANIANFNGYTGTASVSFPSGNAPSANILYANNTFQGTSNYVVHDVYNSDGPKYKFHGVQDVVLLNTNSDAYFPVSFEEDDQGHSGTANRTYDYITPNTTGFETREDWVESTSWNAYDKKSGGITASGNPNYNNTDQPVYSIAKRYFVNKIYLSSSNNNTSTYYDKYDSISFKIRLDWYYSYKSWGQLKTGTIWDKEKTDTKYEQNKTVYVVNYKPIANKISEMKAVYNTIQQNGEGAYCADYLENFYQAAYKVMTLNPNNYPYSSGVESAVQSAAGAIKDVVDNYLTTATTEPTKHTLVDIPGKDATCGEKGLTVGKQCSHCGTFTVAQTEIPATGNHTYGKAEYVNETQHKYVCSVCGNVKTEEHNFVDGKCTECGYSALDLDAYNAAKKVATDRLAKDADMYTEESFKNYRNAVESYTTGEQSFNSQDEVNAATYAIVSADNLLQKRSVTITFVVQKEDDTATSTNPPQTVEWGQSVKLDTESDYVSKWTITVNGVTSKMYSNATFIEHVATEDATITAYVTDEKPDTKYSKVTFLGKNSAVVGIKYVAADTTVDTNTLLTVPAIPFYENGKWDKAEITADGSDITVRATYVPKAGDENKCGIHFKGDTKYYNYDSYVYLFNADKSKKYAMYADAEGQELITYLGGVDFSVPRRDDIYIKEVNADEMKAAIGFSGSYQQGLKSSFNVKFWLPEDATLIETGVDLVAKFPDGTVKRAHDRATKFNARNEYTYTASFGDSKKTVEFKPYLTYKKDGVKTTVYGTSQTVEFN